MCTLDSFEAKLLAIFDAPLSILTDQKPLSFWRTFLVYEIDREQRKIKPGMKASKKVHTRLLFFQSMLELIEALYLARGVIPTAREHLAFMHQEADRYKHMVDRVIGMCEDWKERAQEDSPTGCDYLHPANLAMRLQRPHKSN